MHGVSVVVCCHNSARRLRAALGFLAAQINPDNTPWEVIVVDNASHDDTAETARREWPATAPAPLRAVAEPRLGLVHARIRGFAEARYELVAFVDDDNWVARDWVQQVARVMTLHPDTGACTGLSEPAADGPLPVWFSKFQIAYAVSPAEWISEDVTETRGWLWGAGLVVRKSAWDDLVRAGWHWQLTGRCGAAVTSGEDSELCFALKAAGWRLRYDTSLRLRHHITPERLEWRYLRRLIRGAGEASVIHELYGPQSGSPWWMNVVASAKTGVGASLAGLALVGGQENWRVLAADRERGRMRALWRLRPRYSAIAAEIAAVRHRLADLRAQHPSPTPCTR